MGKFKIPKYALCLIVCSIALNLYLVLDVYVVGLGKWRVELSWSHRAAEEAEAVASVSCSGHGRAYLDGLFVDGKPTCECNTCYGGPDCSLLSPLCPADADGGDPLFLEPFWMKNAAKSAVLVAGWHRMSYVFSDHSFISQELEKQIRKLHTIAKNAVVEGKHIVFGVGSCQLLNAAVYALSSDNSTSPARVVASIPYYPPYRLQTDFLRSMEFKFEGATTSMLNNTWDDGSSDVIEFVTSPNNPDGQLKKRVLQGKTIHDHAYYWPHFTPIPSPSDEDLMLFTISKLTGHAGSRFGWALIRDEGVYQRMLNYIAMSEMGVSRDAQLRAFKLLQVVLEGREIFDFAYETMRNRWERLSNALSMSKRFSLQNIESQYCSYFQKVRGPSPGYAWLKCEREEDKNCAAILRAANIIGREGSLFSDEDCYVRLSLLRRDDDFELLLHWINKLVSQENGVATM